jgi:hypothetical protein
MTVPMKVLVTTMRKVQLFLYFRFIWQHAVTYVLQGLFQYDETLDWFIHQILNLLHYVHQHHHLHQRLNHHQTKTIPWAFTNNEGGGQVFINQLKILEHFP